METKTPQYNTLLFSEIYSEHYTFFKDYLEIGNGAFANSIKEDSLKVLFYILLGRYANTPIANLDINQFKLKLFSIIFQYGPSWEKRLEIQSKIRALTDSEILEGSKTITNHALNPSSAPSTATLEEIEYINDQNTNTLKRGKLEAYSTVLSLLETDVTEDFIKRFSVLFKQFVMPEEPLIYITEGEE